MKYNKKFGKAKKKKLKLELQKVISCEYKNYIENKIHPTIHRKQLRYGQLGITGSWWHINNQVI